MARISGDRTIGIRGLYKTQTYAPFVDAWFTLSACVMRLGKYLRLWTTVPLTKGRKRAVERRKYTRCVWVTIPLGITTLGTRVATSGPFLWNAHSFVLPRPVRDRGLARPFRAARRAEPTTIPVTVMTERRTVSSVTFAEAFVLDGADGVQPPGTYLIETVEEPLDSVSFLGFRRISTTITLPAVGTATLSRQVVAISAQELQTGSLNDDALANE
jgi:hypothetical protein